MSDDQLTLDDRRLCNQIADRHRHDQEAEDLREHHEQIRNNQHQHS